MDAPLTSNTTSAYRICRVCLGQYPEHFFRRAHRAPYAHGARAERHATCERCEQERRDTTKRENRFLVKADTTTRSHARRFSIPAIDLRQQFGWDRHHMAHDAEHAFENGCQHCRAPFASMANGLADLTLDIIDGTKPPHYGMNTRWICATCNRQKRDMPPELYAEKILCHRRWEENQRNPTQPRLF